MNIEDQYQYPPELFRLLTDTIPLLCRSKKDLLLFFRGAGIRDAILTELAQLVHQDPKSITKYDITRRILIRLNERGELALRERREVLRRVTEWEDFSTCWDNDRLNAQGLVAQIQKIVNVKDSFTRINLEREDERRQRQAKAQLKLEEELKRKNALHAVKTDLFSLFAQSNPHKRGKALEDVLNRLFKTNGILVNEAFTLAGSPGEGIIEQIDGAIKFDGLIYLVEMKWWKEPIGPTEVADHIMKVLFRGDARGIFISQSGYTNAAIERCRSALQQKSIILCELKEIVFLLEQEKSLEEFLKAKIRAAIIEKNPLYYPLDASGI